MTCNSTKEYPQYTKEQLVLRAVLSYGLLVFLSTCIHSTNNQLREFNDRAFWYENTGSLMINACYCQHKLQSGKNCDL